jgi:hypothetical protein
MLFLVPAEEDSLKVKEMSVDAIAWAGYRSICSVNKADDLPKCHCPGLRLHGCCPLV